MADLEHRFKTTEVAWEDSTAVLKFTLKDVDGTVVPNTAVTTATMDLELDDGTAIGTQGVDVSGDFNISGVFRRVITAAQNAIQVATATGVNYEDHIAIITVNFTASGETHKMVKNFRIKVEDNPLKP